MFCAKCGAENPDGTQFCSSCGNAAAAVIEPGQVSTASAPAGAQVVNVQVQGQVQKNGIGTAGFVLALLGVFLSWVPVVGWVVWVIGAFRVPRGLAVAGTVLSFIDLILLLVVVSACTASVGAIGLMG